MAVRNSGTKHVSNRLTIAHRYLGQVSRLVVQHLKESSRRSCSLKLRDLNSSANVIVVP